MYNRIEPSKKWSLLGCSAFLLAGCLDQSGGMMDTTSVQLTTGTLGSSGGEDDTTSTSFPPIMTTTQDPGDDSTTSSTDPGTGSTGEPIPPKCGDGDIQADQGEECDDGEANNADDAKCTSHCKNAVCGDGLILKGVEECDDEEANGQYDACNVSCSGPGPRCGDGVIQADEGEQCDNDNPNGGCLKGACMPAGSCLELKDAWQAEADSGLYTIRRADQDLTVWCDMTSDEGGYTFLKFADNVMRSASQAELACESYGMSLFVPRSPDHLASAVAVASSPVLGPVGNGGGGDAQAYLSIMGIYPKVPGLSCVGAALNNTACAQWKANDDGPWFVSDKSLDETQPGTSNCAGCSMLYSWDVMAVPPVLTSYEAFKANNLGATATHFLCDVGDKKGPPT